MNIIATRTDRIGDLVVTIPALHALKQMYPLAKLTILIKSTNIDLIKDDPKIDKIIAIDKYSPSILNKLLKKEKADIFIAFFTNSYVAKLACISRAKIKLAPLSKISTLFFYNRYLWQRRSLSAKSEIEYNLDLLRYLDPSLFAKYFIMDSSLHIRESSCQKADFFLAKNLQDLTKKIIIIHAFSGGSSKNLTLLQYKQLLKNLCQHIDANFIITCNWENKNEAQVIAGDLGLIFNSKNNLSELIAIINKADVFIGSSTGPTHIAGALNKKIVAIYPSTRVNSITRWRPCGTGTKIFIEVEKNHPQENKSPFYENYTKTHELEIIRATKKLLENS